MAISETYGKTPKDIDLAVPLWIKLLEPYKNSEIQEAFLEHLRTESKFPTPDKIIKIINNERLRKVPPYQKFRALEAPKPSDEERMRIAIKFSELTKSLSSGRDSSCQTGSSGGDMDN